MNDHNSIDPLVFIACRHCTTTMFLGREGHAVNIGRNGPQTGLGLSQANRKFLAVAIALLLLAGCASVETDEPTMASPVDQLFWLNHSKVD